MISLICLNLFVYLRFCHHCVRVAGFPFIFWEQFAGGWYYSPELGSHFPDDFEHFFPLNLVADILFAIIFSFISGLIFKFVWVKISSQRVKLK